MWGPFLESIAYGLLGLVMAGLSFIIMDILTPGHLRKQLAEEKNVALGLTVGLCFIGVSIIIAASIVG